MHEASQNYHSIVKKGKKSCQINLSCKSRNIGSHPLNEMAKRVAQNRAHKIKIALKIGLFDSRIYIT